MTSSSPLRTAGHSLLSRCLGTSSSSLSIRRSLASSSGGAAKPNDGNGKLIRAPSNIPPMFTKPQRDLMEKEASNSNNNNNNNTNSGGMKKVMMMMGGNRPADERDEFVNPAAVQDPSLSAQQRTMIDRILHAPIASTEPQIRKDLSIAHRLMARYGYDDLIWNHISARCGKIGQAEDCCDISPDTYLITPGGMHFSEVAPEDLVFDSTEESGNVIHSGIYSHRPDVISIIHAHTVPVMAVSALKCGFKFLVQDAAGFYGKLGYHDWEGIHNSEEEKERVANDLGSNGVALFLRNHGAVVVGRSIQEAWVRFYYLDRCCRVQLEAMKTGAELIECPADMLLHAAEQKQKFFPDGRYEWPALTRLVENQPLHGRKW